MTMAMTVISFGAIGNLPLLALSVLTLFILYQASHVKVIDYIAFLD